MKLTASRAFALLCIPLLFASVSCSKSETSGSTTGTTAASGAGGATTTAAKSGGSTTSAYGGTGTTKAGSTGTTAAAGSGGTGGSAGEGKVVAKDKKFVPEKITIKSGDKVTFTNEDGVPHQPTAGTADKPDPSLFQVTLDAKQTDSTPQIYNTVTYYCELHPTMVGEITVT